MSLADIGAIAGGLNRGIDLAQRDQEFEQTRSMRNEMFDQQRKDWALRNEQSEDTKQKLARERIGKDKLAATDARRYGSATPGSEVAPAQAPVQNATPLPAVAGDAQQAEYIKAWNADENPGVVTTPIPDQAKIESSDATQAAPVANAAPQLPAGGPAQAATPPVAQPVAQSPAQAPQAPKERAQQPMTELEYLRNRHSILSEMHDFAGAEKVRAEINTVQKQVDADNFNLLRNSAGQMTDAQFADAAAKALNADGTPVMTKPPEFKDGKWEFTFYNKHSKHEQVGRFGNKAEMMSALQNHMDRDTYVANANAARAKQDKIDIQNAKGVELNPGAMSFGPPDPVTGKRQQVAVNTNLSPAEARLLDLERRGSGSAGAGGKGAPAANAAYMAAADEAVKNSDTKFATPDEASQVRTFTDMFAHGKGYNTEKLPANVAANAAINFIRSGKKTVVGYNNDTGEARKQYEDKDWGVFDVGPAKPSDMTPEIAQKNTKKLLESQSPGNRIVPSDDGSLVETPSTEKQIAAYQAKLKQAAFDKSGPNGTSVVRKELEDDIKSQVDLQAKLAIAKAPAAKEQILAAAKARTTDQLTVLRRKLDLIHTNLKPDPDKKVDAPAIPVAERLKAVGGIAPSIAQASSKIAEQRSSTLEAQSAARSEEAAAKAERSKETAKREAEASKIEPDAIRGSNDLNELLALRDRYDSVLNGGQRMALYKRISVLNRQQQVKQQYEQARQQTQ